MSEHMTANQTRDDARSEAVLLPSVDVVEDPAGITLYADMPGVSKDRLRLQVDADTLTIEGDIQLDVPEGMDSTHAEVGQPRYRRMFTLSRELDTEKVVAGFDKGVLTLRIPRAAHAQPRKIEIRVE